ncbi:hypothetical protein [Psychromonas ossibalaenae]|uniref:hypothetical protein n=1 Tax=Psychromonas ossibalaenae TaxID=444922 RepID=UPI0003A95F30|nr:hypothetical protein [Psychromonas ossibalaenae]
MSGIKLAYHPGSLGHTFERVSGVNKAVGCPDPDPKAVPFKIRKGLEKNMLGQANKGNKFGIWKFGGAEVITLSNVRGGEMDLEISFLGAEMYDSGNRSELFADNVYIGDSCAKQDKGGMNKNRFGYRHWPITGPFTFAATLGKGQMYFRVEFAAEIINMNGYQSGSYTLAAPHTFSLNTISYGYSTVIGNQTELPFQLMDLSIDAILQFDVYFPYDAVNLEAQGDDEFRGELPFYVETNEDFMISIGDCGSYGENALTGNCYMDNDQKVELETSVRFLHQPLQSHLQYGVNSLFSRDDFVSGGESARHQAAVDFKLLNTEQAKPGSMLMNTISLVFEPLF